MEQEQWRTDSNARPVNEGTGRSVYDALQPFCVDFKSYLFSQPNG